MDLLKQLLVKVIIGVLAMLVTVAWVNKAFAQTQAYTIIVAGDDNLPMPEVTVATASPKRDLGITNVRGMITVNVAPGTTLVFTFVGYETERIRVTSGQERITVRMHASQQSLQEVEVVSRGYVQRSRETDPGSSYKISGAELQDRPVANIEQLLQGKVPGMNIQLNTGAPGFRGTTQIRGLSTLTVTGSGDESFLQPTSPLVVIDGVPIEGDAASEYGFDQLGPGVSPLSLIPQEDIESIEILKDAQATAMYGSQGAYGVFIITTKRGQSEIPRVRYNGAAFLKAPPALRPTLGGALERRLKIKQILENATSQGNIDRISNTPMLSDSLNAYFNNSTDWQSLFYRTTYNQTHNLTIDGGDQQFNYKANLGYFQEKGIIENTGFSRYNANLNFQYQPTPRLSFKGYMYTQLGKQNKGSGQGLLQKGVARNGFASTLLPPPSFYLASSDYLSSLTTANDNYTRVLRPVVEASFMLTDAIRATTFFSYEFRSEGEDTFTPAAANGQFAEVYSYTGRESQLYSRTNVTYSKSWGDRHNFFANVFNEVRMKARQNSATRQERTPNDQFQGPLGFDGERSRGGGILDYRDERAASFAAMASYDYMKRYVIDMAYRIDGSSGNGFEDLYSRNPTVGVRWNIHRENFGENADWLDLASIRASWGINVVPNGTLERIYGKYNIEGNYNGEQGIGLDFGQIPNPRLKPTTSTQYNLGANFTVFNGRLDLIYDTYYKKVDYLLFEQLLSNTVAFDRLISNDAGITNYGHELAITVRPLPRTNPLNLTISVNGAYNRDVLLRLPSDYGGQFIQSRRDDDNESQRYILRVGFPSLSNYALINDGVYSTDADVPINPATGLRYSVHGQPFQAGDPIFRDLNGDYILDENDYTRIGNTQPLVTGGFFIDARYKGYGLSFNASYTAKRTILNNAIAQRLSLMQFPYGTEAGGPGPQVVVPLDDLDMWRQPGDIAKYPYAYDYSRIGIIDPFRYDQTLWAEDGSYFKINSIVASYQFDPRIAQSFGLNRLRVYFSMDNVYTFSSYSGPNPENVTALGRDVSNGYPVPRTFTFGCNIDF
ncbi:SusC/RagA family TonB-linked outer membrane protein [Parapedobacter sp. 10938]|uniref:SusC/RagA family TonB-linked outer membrane protein n=1 Tax=Parapedobacter flavus TaxID=3110225 RepID=UPI002DB60DC3|nr:SusC/RagA family TonB-linked outer membrane protein [Parapedobacter sp. 10938]MEC3881120.1 SusC/RagA family TonB-linked outer membrane protein [Parapedobacter sp. 10938]